MPPSFSLPFPKLNYLPITSLLLPPGFVKPPNYTLPSHFYFPNFNSIFRAVQASALEAAPFLDPIGKIVKVNGLFHGFPYLGEFLFISR